MPISLCIRATLGFESLKESQGSAHLEQQHGYIHKVSREYG